MLTERISKISIPILLRPGLLNIKKTIKKKLVKQSFVLLLIHCCFVPPEPLPFMKVSDLTVGVYCNPYIRMRGGVCVNTSQSKLRTVGGAGQCVQYSGAQHMCAE